jgi:two-component system, LuxR family, response regulator FixJ
MHEPRDVTVFIVDDDRAVRDSLSLLLSVRGYRTSTFASAEDFLAALRPDWQGCLIADIRLPGMDGLELQRELARRGVALPVVIVTAHGDVGSARAAFKADAVDFLEKPFDEDGPVAAVEAALRRQADRASPAGRDEESARRVASLTEREKEVMALLVEGLHNVEVARRLGISPRTVEVHKARVMAKLEARNLAELIRVAQAAR